MVRAYVCTCLRKREQRGAGEGKKRVERGERRGRSGLDSQARWEVPEGREQKGSLPPGLRTVPAG